MSLNPCSIAPVPQETARGVRAAFPKGNRDMTMRDALGVIYPNDLFADLSPQVGHDGEPPWRLALVTLMQCSEHLTDRPAAEAGRGRIDWQYALGLALTATGFALSGLSALRPRLLGGAAAERLLIYRARAPPKARQSAHRRDAYCGRRTVCAPLGNGRRDTPCGPACPGASRSGLATRPPHGAVVPPLRPILLRFPAAPGHRCTTAVGRNDRPRWSSPAHQD